MLMLRLLFLVSFLSITPQKKNILQNLKILFSFFINLKMNKIRMEFNDLSKKTKLIGEYNLDSNTFFTLTDVNDPMLGPLNISNAKIGVSFTNFKDMPFSILAEEVNVDDKVGMKEEMKTEIKNIIKNNPINDCATSIAVTNLPMKLWPLSSHINEQIQKTPQEIIQKLYVADKIINIINKTKFTPQFQENLYNILTNKNLFPHIKITENQITIKKNDKETLFIKPYFVSQLNNKHMNIVNNIVKSPNHNNDNMFFKITSSKSNFKRQVLINLFTSGNQSNFIITIVHELGTFSLIGSGSLK